MDEIDLLTEQLLEHILQSETYRDYQRLEQELRQQPELFEKVNQFRGENFQLQQNQEISSEAVRRLQEESAELHRNPLVSDYLDAELAVCKVIQRVCRKLTNGIDLSIPEI